VTDTGNSMCACCVSTSHLIVSMGRGKPHSVLLADVDQLPLFEIVVVPRLLSVPLMLYHMSSVVWSSCVHTARPLYLCGRQLMPLVALPFIVQYSKLRWKR